MTPAVLSRAAPGRNPATNGVPIRLWCSCGADASWSAVAGQTWTCPGCERTWQPDPVAVETVSAGAHDLVRLRTHLVWLLVGLAVVALVLAAVRPEWILGAPLLVGGTLLVLQPTYRRRRTEAVARLRTTISLRGTGRP